MSQIADTLKEWEALAPTKWRELRQEAMGRLGIRGVAMRGLPTHG